MSKLLSRFKRNAIDSFLADVGESNNYFVFVGGQSEYPTSDTPLEVDNEETLYRAREEMMFGKTANFIRMTKKYVWSSGTVYAQYDDTEDLTDKNFFVVTSTRDVFKCVYNNGGLPSTQQPTKRAFKLAVPVQESDGYEWLYLYTISNSDNTKFTTASYMPVVANTLISDSAKDGALFNIAVESRGIQYPSNSGNLTFSNTSVLRLASGANTSVNYYRDSSLTAINTTTGNTYVRKILSSNSSLWVTTEAFPNNFLSNTDCVYYVGPTIEIASRTGSGAVAYAIADTGSVDKIQILEYGSGYKDARVSIVSGPGLGSGASARAIISPIGGHGSNVYDELYSDSLGVQCTFDEYGVANAFISDVTYRTVGIIKNPEDKDGNLYTSNTFNQITTINTTGGAGTFSFGEVVRSLVSNSFGKFAYSNSSVVLLTGVTGVFQPGEDILGAVTNARRTVSAESMVVDLDTYSGEILYVQNIQEVTRSENNTEQVKLVISF